MHLSYLLSPFLCLFLFFFDQVMPYSSFCEFQKRGREPQGALDILSMRKEEIMSLHLFFYWSSRDSFSLRLLSYLQPESQGGGNDM